MALNVNKKLVAVKCSSCKNWTKQNLVIFYSIIIFLIMDQNSSWWNVTRKRQHHNDSLHKEHR